MTGLPDEAFVAVRRQLARPAVERRFLLHIIFTPPVLAERVASLLEVMVVSSSLRSDWAISSREDSKAFLAAEAARFSSARRFFSGLLGGFEAFRGDEQGLGGSDEQEVEVLLLGSMSSSSESDQMLNRAIPLFRGLTVSGGLRGEY